MAQKPSIPKGTRDFGPQQMAGRNYIFDTVRSVFDACGFAQIETPAMENLSTLLGKYGEEGDRLLFRILNSGDAFGKVDPEEYRGEDGSLNSLRLSNAVCEKGLRYDLTVPFARFVVQHREELVFPFKRYQIQPVWRADRPQKGRYREFYQCDADIIGSRSQLCEAELVQIVDRVFARLGIRVCLKINNRKVLTGLAEVCGFPEKVVDITVAIDKIEKVGLEAVCEELSQRGISPKGIDVIRPVLQISGTREEKLALLRGLFSGEAGNAASAEGLKGVDELEELFGMVSAAGVSCAVELDLSLARGLNYYTGAIFEVKALDYPIGSICGGGRYDNLTGIFGLPDTSGVGISFGADRIYDVLGGLDKFPASLSSSTRLLFANLGGAAWLLPLLSRLRAEGVACELYPDAVKLRKQFEYAERRGIPFLSVCGEEEEAAGQINLKNLSSGEQKRFALTDIAAMLDFLR